MHDKIVMCCRGGQYILPPSSCFQSSIQFSIDNGKLEKCLTLRVTTVALSWTANAAMSRSASSRLLFCLRLMTHKRTVSSQICFVQSYHDTVAQYRLIERIFSRSLCSSSP